MTENAEAKARRYLAEGRLTITHVNRDAIYAVCRGGGALYHPQWQQNGGWSCDCPARTDKCAHLLALQLVTVRKEEP